MFEFRLRQAANFPEKLPQLLRNWNRKGALRRPFEFWIRRIRGYF
jgi:hypothetical protein